MAEQITQAGGSGTHQPQRFRILVVEDDEAFGQALGRMLHGAGYMVDVTHHFAPALDLLDRPDAPDLLLTDIVAPAGGVNGLALARMARIKHPSINIIYMTGFDVRSLEREALGSVLKKPFSDDLLLSKVSRLLTG